MFDKLDFIFTKMPRSDFSKMKDQKRLVFKLQCLNKIAQIMRCKISEKNPMFPEMLVSPLGSKNELNMGVSNEFLSIYESQLLD